MNLNSQNNAYDVIQMFTSKWKIFLFTSMFFLLGAWIKFDYYPDYIGTGKLIIKDNRNSQLQFLILQTTNIGIDKNYNSSIKEIDESSKADALLNSHAFFNYLSKSAKSFFPENKDITFEELSIILESMIKITLQKNNIIQFEIKSRSQKLTSNLLTLTLNSARNFLIENELNDLSLAESYFDDELKDVNSRIGHIENRTLHILRNVDSIFLFSDPVEGNKYQSELYENISRARLAINENKNRINEIENKLGVSRKVIGDLNKFSSLNVMNSLILENKSLLGKIGDLESVYRRFENQKTNSLPIKYEIERMKVNHEFEYRLYSSLVEKISLLGLQKLYVQGKIQILEADGLLRVHNSPSFKLLLLFSLSLAFTLCFFGIYFYELFKPNKI